MRHLPLRRHPEVQGRLVPAHHGVCRQAARRPRRSRLPAEHPPAAGQLDRQVHRRIRQLPRQGHGRRDAPHLHDPSRHALRRHLHGHGSGASDDRQVCRPDRQHGRHRSIPQRVREEDRVRKNAARQGQDRRQDRRPHRHQPRQRQGSPHLRGGLRHDGLRHRRHHGGPGARPARL